ncbi:MAG TPA: SRPBCC family protein [Sphingomicrobium sp.]|nr:SRPBCC family protein [Sphingomicrobium sp.]
MDDQLDLRLERELDAPLDLVWKAWTDPEHIKRWWAPKPYETPECEIELRPGGKFMTRMTGPDGFDYSGTACVLEVVPLERIVWSSTMKEGYRPNEFADDGCNGFPFTAIHTFEDAGAGKTRYTATVLHATAKDRDAHDAMGFEGGWATCAEQMAEVARSLGAEA